MTREEAAQLKVGSRIMWDDNPNDLGTVTKQGQRSGSVFVVWDNGGSGWLNYWEAGKMSLAEEE